ncbi:hypothetical protein QUA41_30750 [Microcoleus sp. Pol11C1]|uniref:hypothetical protein n=1 Tax=unclassified Microcoleus TaxID=2642155 RepID=UPI002FD1413D
MGELSTIKYLVKNAEKVATITAAFTKYKLGQDQPKVNAPARGPSVLLALASFDTKDATKNTLVKASGRAMAAGTKTATGATDAVLNIETGTTPDTARRRDGYKPAKVTIFVPEVASKAGEPAPAQGEEDTTAPTGAGSADSTSTTPISRVTGLEYRRRLGNSFTYPFGSSATPGQDKEEGMMSFLYARLSTGGKSLSFSGEEAPRPNKR